MVPLRCAVVSNEKAPSARVAAGAFFNCDPN
jgi:hypothetical protein